MSRTRPVADELTDLLLDCLEYQVFKPNTPDAKLAATVARKGLRALSVGELEEWERRVLPVVSLPIKELVDRARF